MSPSTDTLSTDERSRHQADAAALMQRLIRDLRARAPAQPLPAATLELIYAGAYAELEAGRYPRAELMYTYLASQAPQDARFAEGLGLALARQGKAEPALVMLATAASLTPGAPAPLLNLAELLAAQGLHAAAASLFELAAHLARKDPAQRALAQRADAMLEILHGPGR